MDGGDEIIYGIHQHEEEDYADKGLMMSAYDENMMMMMIPLMNHNNYNHHHYYDHNDYYNSMINPSTCTTTTTTTTTTGGVFGSQSEEAVGLINIQHQGSSVGTILSESSSANNNNSNTINAFQARHHIHHEEEEEEAAASRQRRNSNSHLAIKAKIASHPTYPRLLHAYIDCQKVGAPPEIEKLLDEMIRIRRETTTTTTTNFNNNIKQQQDHLLTCPSSLGVDPELDNFMETYCDILVKYKSDLTRPFHEATSFLHTIQSQLGNLLISNDDGDLSSDDEELGGGEIEIQDAQMKSEDRELKDKLLRRYGGHISSLKLEFSKKKKKGKLPKEARQTLLDWWNVHYKWPYPTEGDKILLAETTGLDQKQINNWFINQRKRHWKASENMQLAMMDNLSAAHQYFAEDN